MPKHQQLPLPCRRRGGSTEPAAAASSAAKAPLYMQIHSARRKIGFGVPMHTQHHCMVPHAGCGMLAWCPLPSRTLHTARAIAAPCCSRNPSRRMSVLEGVLRKQLSSCQTGHSRNDGWWAAEAADPTSRHACAGGGGGGRQPQPGPFGGGLTASFGSPNPSHAFLGRPPNPDSVQNYTGSALVPTRQRTMTGGWSVGSQAMFRLHGSPQYS